MITPIDSSVGDGGIIFGLALQSDGAIVAAGQDTIAGTTDYFVARYLGDPAPPSLPMMSMTRLDAAPEAVPLVIEVNGTDFGTSRKKDRAGL